MRGPGPRTLSLQLGLGYMHQKIPMSVTASATNISSHIPGQPTQIRMMSLQSQNTGSPSASQSPQHMSGQPSPATVQSPHMSQNSPHSMQSQIYQSMFPHMSPHMSPHMAQSMSGQPSPHMQTMSGQVLPTHDWSAQSREFQCNLTRTNRSNSEAS